MHYSEEQQAAIDCRDHCLVVACPGSGKSRMLVGKVAALLRECSPNEIMIVTFTNKAAEEMRERLMAAVGAAAKRLLIGTFHKLGKNELIRAGGRPRVLHDGERHSLIRQVLDSMTEAPGDMEECIRYIAKYKSQIKPIFPEGDTPILRQEQAGYNLFISYQEALSRMGVIDVDDLVRECVLGYQSNRMTPPPVKHLLVDEFQDTDPIQLAFCLAIAARGARITGVGDDDQSIYAFRNSLGAEGMESLLKETAGRLFFLSTNYRSREGIIHVADRVIRHNSNRVRKELQACRKEDADIAVCTYESDYAEAEAAIAFYEAALRDGARGNEVAIMARTNDALDLVDTMARSRGHRVSRRGGGSFMQREHVIHALALAKAGAVPDDIVSLALATEGFGLSRDTRQLVQSKLIDIRHRAGKDLSVADLLYDAELVQSLSATEATLFREFRFHLCEWLEAAESARGCANPVQTAALMDALGIALEAMKHHLLHPSKREDLNSLMRLLARLDGSLARRLHFLQYNLGKGSAQETLEDAVQLMTFHGSKGLEFERVWLLGCNHQKLPHKDADVEEERRLFYVGITRAKDILRISAAVDGDKNVPSEFLAETGLPIPGTDAPPTHASALSPSSVL